MVREEMLFVYGYEGGSTHPLFDSGYTYWWNVEAIDSKGGRRVSPYLKWYRHFTSPEHTGGAVLQLAIYSNLDSSLLTSANIAFGDTVQALSSSTGLYQVPIPNPENLTVDTCASQGASQGGIATTLKVSSANFNESTLPINPSCTEVRPLSISLTPSSSLSLGPVTSPTNQPNQTLSGTRAAGTTITINFSSAATVGAATYPTDTTWSVQATLAPGNNAFTVTARTAAGSESRLDGLIIYDATLPTATVTAPDPTHLEVTFSEPVNDAAATNPSNYTITGGVSGIQVTAVEFLAGSAYIYRLTTSHQSTGTQYSLTIGNITDTAGNSISTSPIAFRRTANTAPTAPTLSRPATNTDVTSRTPTLEVNTSSDAEGDNLTYLFEVSLDSGFGTLAASGTGTVSGNIASWAVNVALADNTRYYWRSQASDGSANSPYMTTASFFVNTANDFPSAPGISSPAVGTQVPSRTPTLTVTNASDPDGDTLTYQFQIASDANFTAIVAQRSGIAQGPGGTTSWTSEVTLNENATYYWRCRATDEEAYSGNWASASFVVNTANDAPSAPSVSSPVQGAEVASLAPPITVLPATDPDSVNLTYIFEIDTVNTFNSSNKQTSAAISSTSWTPSTLRDNTVYYYRVKACDDGNACGPYMDTVTFFVNTANDPPSVPTIQNPAPGGVVLTLKPTLSVNPAIDPDRDDVTYEFELYGDSSYQPPKIGGATGQGTSWTTPPLSDGATYYFRVRAVDKYGLASISWAEGSFSVSEQKTVNIQLVQGWNLISIPRITSSPDITSVLADISGDYLIVWAYDHGGWKKHRPGEVSDLATMMPGKGYWIFMREQRNLAVTGQEMRTAVSLKAGWNLVGWNRTGSSPVQAALGTLAPRLIWGYDHSAGWKGYMPGWLTGLTDFAPGQGYWIKVAVDTEWSQ